MHDCDKISPRRVNDRLPANEENMSQGACLERTLPIGSTSSVFFIAFEDDGVRNKRSAFFFRDKIEQNPCPLPPKQLI
jgi:hypothetical protein